MKHVKFAETPLTSVCRPPETQEYWILFDFESHSRSCHTCTPNSKILCGSGFYLALRVSSFFRSNGKHVLSTLLDEGGWAICLEIPKEYSRALALLHTLRTTDTISRIGIRPYDEPRSAFDEQTWKSIYYLNNSKGRPSRYGQDICFASYII